jgi:hypothetical protein
MTARRLPLWLKIVWTAWVVVWIPLYWRQYSVTTFLWFCDFANFILLAALWRESALLFSWQAVSVLVFQLAYAIDILGRAAIGRHPIGGTEWIFDDPRIPGHIKALSVTMHLATPPLLIWAVRKVGYDKRALALQAATAAVLLPVSWLVGDPKDNLNWVWRPFNKAQTLMAPWLYLLVCIVGYTVLVFLPTHLVLKRLYGKDR